MAEKTKLWYLQNFNIFEGMDESAMEEIDRRSKMRKTSKKEILYFPDEPNRTIYFLKEGKVKISRVSEDGRTTTLQLIGPGEIFGETSILGQRIHENVAEAVENSIICTISKEMFQDMLNRNPKLNLKINKFIGFRLRRIEAHVEDLVFKDARERIIAFLSRYVQTFGKKLIDGWMIRPFLTHQEIADLTATSRQTVTTILNEMVNDGKIDYTRRYFRVVTEDWFQS
jgi:CRP-like cAMP-binding protein